MHSDLSFAAVRANTVLALVRLVSAPLLVGTGSSRSDAGAAPKTTVARPADDVAHPGSRTEWWYVHAVQPGSGRTVIAVFFTAPIAAAAGLLYTNTSMTRW